MFIIPTLIIITLDKQYVTHDILSVPRLGADVELSPQRQNLGAVSLFLSELSKSQTRFYIKITLFDFK